MELIDRVSNPSGLCVLSTRGELAFYDSDRVLEVDTVFTARWRDAIDRILDRFHRAPDQDGMRVATVAVASGMQAWGGVSLFLGEDTIRSLYPVADRNNQVLTSFQRKNIEKSLYRGLELLLEYRQVDTPKSVSFCPVLYERPGAGNSAVIDVINLVAGMSAAQRSEPLVVNLWERLYSGLIRKDRRNDGGLAILSDADNQWRSGADGTAFEEIDKRWDRAVNISAEELARLHALYRHDLVERWLEIPYRPVDPARLRQFVHFRGMDDARLILIAKLALVYTAPPGVCLLERGMTDDWNLYLLEGSVTLKPEEGATLVVEGGSERGASPVAFLKPRKYTVLAASKISFLWVHDKLLHVAQTSGKLPTVLSEAAAKAETDAMLAQLRGSSPGER